MQIHVVTWQSHSHTHCMGEWTEIDNCASNRIHQIDQIFLAYIEEHVKAWVGGYNYSADNCRLVVKISGRSEGYSSHWLIWLVMQCRLG